MSIIDFDDRWWGFFTSLVSVLSSPIMMKFSFHDRKCHFDQEDVLFLNSLLPSSLEGSCYQCKCRIINHLLTLVFLPRALSSHMSGKVHISFS